MRSLGHIFDNKTSNFLQTKLPTQSPFRSSENSMKIVFIESFKPLACDYELRQMA